MEGYGSSDTADERAPALVRGKSFISVDLLGQVDWSWASRFTLFLYNPCPRPSLPHLPRFSFLLLSADTIPAITANSEDDGTKILLCYKSRDLVPHADTIKLSFWGRGLKCWGCRSCCSSTELWKRCGWVQIRTQFWKVKASERIQRDVTWLTFNRCPASGPCRMEAIIKSPFHL